MSTNVERLTVRIIFKAVFPVIKVLLEEDPRFKKQYEKIDAKVQFVAKDEQGDAAAFLYFHDGELDIVEGEAETPQLTFFFSNFSKMIAMFAGKPVIPRIRGWTHLGLLIKVLRLLMAMKLLLPTANPKSPEQARLKVKMTLYMITTALSQLNKAGDTEMRDWTSKQPLRIYQWSCEPEGIASYLKIKAGRSKAGRGYYERRKPFVHIRFSGAEAAIPVLSNSVDMVKAMAEGILTVEGSPEYAAAIGTFMVRIATMLS